MTLHHHPFGTGHAYLIGMDDRVPHRPLRGEPFALHVRTSSDVAEVRCEWVADAHATALDMARVDALASSPPGAAGTHLTAAAERAPAGDRWSAQVAPFSGVGVYRFVSTTTRGQVSTSRWFAVHAAEWRAGAGDLVVDGVDRVVPHSAQWLVDSEGVHRVRFALRLEEGEHVVGFGERFDALDQRGRTLDAVVFEQYKGQGAAGRTYLPMPFAHVTGGSGWGFHVRTSRRTWFDVGASTPDRLVVEAELGGASHEKLSLGLYDGDVPAVLRQFLDEVGRPEELPAWVFTLWASANNWNTQSVVQEQARRHAETDVPFGVLVIEAWSDESTFVAWRDAQHAVHDDGSPHRLADFTFPPDGAWPDPAGMVADLHEQGVRVLLWQIPLQKMRPHPSGQAAADAAVMRDRGYGVHVEGGRDYRNRGWWFPLALMPDFTNDEAREWWLAKRRYLVDEVGIDGFKTDGGEHAWGRDLRYADGRHGDEGNNLFPVDYARAYGDLLRSAGKAPVTFSRAGFTGSQAHGVFWAGDEDSTWVAFRSSLLAGLTASACGVLYWGWDVAGFSGEVPDAELYVRAAAVSCFLPIMQYHSEFTDRRLPARERTPWNIAERTGDARALTVFRRFAHLRQRLVGYLEAEARVAVAESLPLLRSVALFTGDDEAWDHPLSYFLGDALLVAPIVDAAAEAVTTRLPTGEWIDVCTGEAVAGGRVLTRVTPWDEVAVWCRAERWAELAPSFADLPTVAL